MAKSKKKRASKNQVKMDGLMKPLIKGAVTMAGISMIGSMAGGMAGAFKK